MINCPRCLNTGKILERYVPRKRLPPVQVDGPVLNEAIETKERWRECPVCLGFSAAGRP